MTNNNNRTAAITYHECLDAFGAPRLRQSMTMKEWEAHLFPREIEALEDYCFLPDEHISPRKVFDTIVRWNGGFASGFEVRSLINRVYGIDL